MNKQSPNRRQSFPIQYRIITELFEKKRQQNSLAGALPLLSFRNRVEFFFLFPKKKRKKKGIQALALSFKVEKNDEQMKVHSRKWILFLFSLIFFVENRLKKRFSFFFKANETGRDKATLCETPTSLSLSLSLSRSFFRFVETTSNFQWGRGAGAEIFNWKAADASAVATPSAAFDRDRRRVNKSDGTHTHTHTHSQTDPDWLFRT